MILNGIDKVFIISAIPSFSRREEMEKRLKFLGIENYEFYISGPLPIYSYFYDFIKERYKNDKENEWVNSPNEIGATLAHLNVIQMSKMYGYKNVLILEDDTLLRKDFVNLFNKAFGYLPNDFKIANLIVNAQTPIDDIDVNYYWTKTKGSSLACSYVLNVDFADYILNYYKNNYLVIDVFYYFDQYINSYYTLKDPIAVPNPQERSSITNEFVLFDYIDYKTFI